MVSDHDTDVLRRFYDAINDEDVEAAMDLCDRQVQVYLPPDVVKVSSDVGLRSTAAP